VDVGHVAIPNNVYSNNVYNILKIDTPGGTKRVKI